MGALIQREDQLQQRLFPDAAARAAAETRQWDMTVNHWDLPIAGVDPHR